MYNGNIISQVNRQVTALYTFPSVIHHCIGHLGKSRENEVRRDHLISSNEIMKYCQMPLVPPLPGDKQMSLSLPNSAAHLGYVRLVFHMLQS